MALVVVLGLCVVVVVVAAWEGGERGEVGALLVALIVVVVLATTLVFCGALCEVVGISLMLRTFFVCSLMQWQTCFPLRCTHAQDGMFSPDLWPFEASLVAAAAGFF